MDNVLEQLEQLLQSQLDVHNDFLASSREFNCAIKEQNITKIDQHRAIHDETICRIEKLEEQRIACCSLLARSLGIVKAPLRLSMVLEKVPLRWRERLCGIQLALKDKIREFGVKKIGLFGSVLKGKQKWGSDVDILVETLAL